MSGARKPDSFLPSDFPREARRRGEGPRQLTAREHRIVSLVAEGRTNREIAVVIGTTENVVKNYLRTIYIKLGVWNRTELALWSLAHERESA